MTPIPKSISDIHYIYRTSDIYILRPISISDVRYLPISILDVRYLYWTSDIYIGRPICILDIRYLYPTSDIQIPTSARARARLGLELGQGYWMSEIYIEHQI